MSESQQPKPTPKWQIYTISFIFVFGILSWILLSTGVLDEPKTKPTNTEERILDTVWQAFIHHPGNGGEELNRLISGELIKRGTVDSTALVTATTSRLPAYIACYKHNVYIPDLGDMDSDMCVYYIGNPSKKTHAILWRGKDDMPFLEQKLLEDGFISDQQ